MSAFDERLNASRIDYSYNPPGPGGPHAVYTAGEYEYGYDAAGNVATRTNDLAGLEQTFTYSGALALPTRIDAVSSSGTSTHEIEYCPDGERVVKRRMDTGGAIEEELIYVGMGFWF